MSSAASPAPFDSEEAAIKVILAALSTWGNTSAGRNFWLGQNLCLQAEISAWNSGLEKTSRKFRPGIPGQNFKPKFQDRIPSRNVKQNCFKKTYAFAWKLEAGII